ncbi:MAG: FUSC family protein [Sulfurimonas sp.]|nr:FUSC family protein [Sulfurimonas sp.]
MTSTLKRWLKLDFPEISYVVKVVLSALVAMYIAILFNLPSPQTAMLSVFIVVQPQSGLVFLKSYYRFIGTLIGAVVAVVLMSAFSQDRVWFIFFLTIWIAFCTAGGFKYRNFASYGFVLSGYTVLIITLPTLYDPQLTFLYAIDRVSEISVGLISASVISEVIFPLKISNSLRVNERERFKKLFQTLAFSDNIFNLEKLEETHSGFTQEILAPHAIRINSALESGMSKEEIEYYEQLNSEFMHLSTSFHSLRTIFYNFGQTTPKYLNEALISLYAPIEKVLQKYSDRVIKHENITYIIKDLGVAKEEIIQKISDQNDEVFDERYKTIEFLIQRVLNELMVYLHTYEIYHSINKPKVSKKRSSAYKFKTHSDTMLILLAVARGGSVLLVSMFLWIASGWDFAQFSVLFAVASTIIFSSIPSPTPLMILKGFFVGMLVSMVVTYAYSFYLIPLYGTNIVTLSILLIPVLAYGGWSTYKPQRVPIGFGFIAVMFMLFHIDLSYDMDIIAYFDLCFASLLGLLIAGIAYIVFDSYSSVLMTKRISKLFRGKVSALCSKEPETSRVEFESIGLDLVQQLSSHGQLKADDNKKVFQWLLLGIEVGRAIIHIKKRLKHLTFINQKKGYDILMLLQEYIKTKEVHQKEILLQEYRRELDISKATLANSVYEGKKIKAVIREFTLIYILLDFSEKG